MGEISHECVPIETPLICEDKRPPCGGTTCCGNDQTCDEATGRCELLETPLVCEAPLIPCGATTCDSATHYCDANNTCQLAAPLGMVIRQSTATLTPIIDGTYSERSTTFEVDVSGLPATNALGLRMDKVEGLSMEVKEVSSAGDKKTFRVTVDYNGKAEFSAGSAALCIRLSNMPPAHRGAPKSTHLAIVDGQKNTRPIPLRKANIVHFNNYANTEHGLQLHYRLMENIVLEPPAALNGSNWTPIGIADPLPPFTGSFDGGGSIITGLTIQHDETTGTQGLFGIIGDGAVIKNIGLENVNISTPHSDSVGGLVGAALRVATVENCYVSGRVRGHTGVGGILGYSNNMYSLTQKNDLLVRNCFVTADVSGDLHVGGVAGNTMGTVQNCYSTGSVTGNYSVGGVLGTISSGQGYNTLLENSYATGKVVSAGNVAGGLVGGQSIEMNSGAVGTIRNSIALNPSVTTIAPPPESSRDIGRVAASLNTPHLVNNFAFAGMENIDGSTVTTTWPNEGADKVDGESKSSAQLRTAAGFPSVFTQAPWSYTPGELPILSGLPGSLGDKQPRALPEHL